MNPQAQRSITFENEDFVVKSSKIEGLGLFAKRTFNTGEVVLRWHPKRLSESELRNISPDERRYVNTLDDGTKVLMQIPERYVNHSDTPNTKTVGETDVAIRDIRVGEEVTSSYEF